MRNSASDLVTKSTVPLRSLFLSCLGLIHLIAFWSYYVQFPGLLSSSGIEPVHRLLRHAAPKLHRQGWTDDDSLCELVAILGMLVGTIIASGLCQHGLLFGLQTALYSLLVRTGGTFYSFQWDTLLLETTAVTALTYAPWLQLRPTPHYTSPAAPWPLRFVLFKLMFMSGAVKLQANCPTWLNLTALEYHFCTQCLPGPLAWHAHQMHPFLLRLGVAMTLWLEIPATFLLVFPWNAVRQTGAVLQVLLQLLIVLTGNYNFFNILTMTLCIPVMDDNSVSKSDKEPASTIRRTKFFCRTACLVYSVGTFFAMFEISTTNHVLSIRLRTTSQEVDRYTEALLPFVFYSLVTGLAVQTVRQTIVRRSAFDLLHGSICIGVIGMVALPLFSLTLSLQRVGFVGLRTRIAHLYQKHLRPYHLSNGYGLFRHMTGVGGTSPTATTGWAGLPPSVVARPEIILEVQFDDEAWHELSFRWKPGNTEVLPRQVAPHQPRLDWQMWFAALGRLNNNPWFIHLIKKLLDGCEPVVDLLGDPKLRGQQVLQIRAKVYHYDFTRIETDWSKTIPGVTVLPGNGTFWSKIRTMTPSTVWHRTFDHEYMGAIEVGNPLLDEYIESHGYNSVCLDSKNRCQQDGNLWCWVAKTIRDKQLHLVCPLLFAVIVLARRRCRVELQKRQHSKEVLLHKKNQ